MLAIVPPNRAVQQAFCHGGYDQPRAMWTCVARWHVPPRGANPAIIVAAAGRFL
jgi:hypothetical protein